MDVFFIYGLVDSGEPGVIRYVGQTQSLSVRWKQHSKGPDCESHRMSCWKWAVGFFGRSVEMRLLEVVYGSRADALARERWHVLRLSETHRLMNGAVQRQAFKRHGVPDLIAESYGSALSALRELAETDMGGFVVLGIADVVDKLETCFPVLMICGKTDCFRERIRYFRNSREDSVDSLCVSR